MTVQASEPLIIDEELLRRFGGRGPRYTSYPTADRFDDRVGAERYGQALSARAGRRGEPLGLYVHIPFCRSICYYCGCNKIGTRHVEQSTPYLAALEREAMVTALTAAASDQPSALGGGTPTFMPDAELGALTICRGAFDFRDDGEHSIDRPATVSPAARARRSMG